MGQVLYKVLGVCSSTKQLPALSTWASLHISIILTGIYDMSI